MNTKLKMSKKEVDSLEDFDLCSKIFDHYFDLIYDNDLHAYTEGQKAVYSLTIIDGQIGNGGFIQLFLFSRNNYDLITTGLKALQFINANENYEILNQAVKIYENIKEWFIQYDEDGFDIESQKYVNDVNAVDALSTKWYEAQNERDSKLFSYIRHNIEEFVFLI